MGCLQSCFEGQPSSSNLEEETTGTTGTTNLASDRPKYSWEKKKLDPKDYMIENLKGETAGKIPGSLNGQQFIIRNCEDCNIYLFDHTAQVTLDDCVNCRVFIGPVKGSVFIRDCKDCKFVIACQQFRTRDCQNLDVFLSCATQPIIEATTKVKFGCFQYYYPELDSQFKAAEVSVFDSNWSNIYDFTPVPGEKNFSLLPEDAKVEDFVAVPTNEQFSNVSISTERSKSSVPYTIGTRRKPSDEGCLVAFFKDGDSHNRAHCFIKQMKEKSSQSMLVRTKEIAMQPSDAQNVFGSNESYIAAIQQGPVIGFEYNGDGCVQACLSVSNSVSNGKEELIFVSSDQTSAKDQIQKFYDFAEMQMGV